MNDIDSAIRRQWGLRNKWHRLHCDARMMAVRTDLEIEVCDAFESCARLLEKIKEDYEA